MAVPPNVSLRGLRTFCAAAKHESFREAGDELFITASAVSHQIKSLEQELDQVLFERGGRELKLTETGRALYEEVDPLLDKLGRIVGRYKASLSRRSVRVSVQPFFGSELFVPRLSEFTAANPDIDIHVGTSDESAEKHPPDADLSIRLFKKPPEHLTSFLLFPLRLVPAGSRDFKKTLRVEGGEIVSDFPVIAHETQPKAWKQWQKSSGIRLPKDSKRTRLDSMIAAVRACERGLGAALVPVPIADQWFSQGTIVRLFDHDLVSKFSYYLVCRDGHEDDESVVLLRQWILATFAENP